MPWRLAQHAVCLPTAQLACRLAARSAARFCSSHAPAHAHGAVPAAAPSAAPASSAFSTLAAAPASHFSSAAAPGASRLHGMLDHNHGFVARKEYEQHAPPDMRVASPAGALSASAPAHAPAHKGSARCVVVSCMDTRLTTLLPSALGLRPGDAKIIKSAGAIISGPFGGITRSVVIALYELGANEVFVVGHHDCGMAKVDASETMEKMVEHGGIARETLATLTHAGIDVRRWLAGFSSVQQSVKESVALLRNHPLVPRAVPVSGLIIDPDTGKLDLVVDGTLDAGVIAARSGAPLK